MNGRQTGFTFSVTNRFGTHSLPTPEINRTRSGSSFKRISENVNDGDPSAKPGAEFRSKHSMSAGAISLPFSFGSNNALSASDLKEKYHNSESARTLPDCESTSPKIENKTKKWRMGDKTRSRSKTRDVIKRWQKLAEAKLENSNLRKESKSETSDSSKSKNAQECNLPVKDEKKKWSVYVWSTWVRRPYDDEDEVRAPEGKTFLSSFQEEKFRYYFTDVFDHNKDKVITIEDIEALNERMRHYAGWSEDNEYFLATQEIHADFFECLLEHVGKIEPEYGFEFDVDRIRDRVQLCQWLNMWGNLTHGAKAMSDFPVWLQILPRILFKVINRRDNGVISFEELRKFYCNFIKLKPDQVEPIAQEAYAALTSCGDFPLTEHIYLMTFANFLLGKTAQGPGKYIFGVFKDSADRPFQIDYSCFEEPLED